MTSVDGNCALCIQEKATKIGRSNGNLYFLGSHMIFFFPLHSGLKYLQDYLMM